MSGPARWAKLHIYALRITAPELPAIPAWLVAWAEELAGCGCGSGWKEIAASHPPNLSSPEEFFAWSIDRHNDINRLLRKPIMSTDAARAYWSQFKDTIMLTPPTKTVIPQTEVVLFSLEFGDTLNQQTKAVQHNLSVSTQRALANEDGTGVMTIGANKRAQLDVMPDGSPRPVTDPLAVAAAKIRAALQEAMPYLT